MGGPPATVRAIARALVARGHEVTVLTADRGRGISDFELRNADLRAKGEERRGKSGEQRSEVRDQRSEGGEQKAEGGKQKAESTKQRTGWVANEDGVEAVYLGTLQNYRATTINPGILRFCTSRLGNYDVVHIYGLYDLLGSVVAW